MPRVSFTSALKRFYPNLEPQEVQGSTVKQVLKELESKFPGLTDYLLTEQGNLRQHVNIFLGDQLVEDREQLSDAVRDHEEIYIIQALSGG